MAHQVIISYSNHDKPQADAICNRLESKGIRCWIAPRDVPAGSEYADSIVQAIESSQVLVLVYSANADKSTQVRREVERAVSSEVQIIPVRIDDAKMSHSFEYYVGSIHWLDAITPPLEHHIDKLAAQLKVLLTKDSESDAAVSAVEDTSPTSQPAASVNKPDIEAPSSTGAKPSTATSTPDSGSSSGRGRKFFVGAVVFVVALVIAVMLANQISQDREFRREIDRTLAEIKKAYGDKVHLNASACIEEYPDNEKAVNDCIQNIQKTAAADALATFRDRVEQINNKYGSEFGEKALKCLPTNLDDKKAIDECVKGVVTQADQIKDKEAERILKVYGPYAHLAFQCVRKHHEGAPRKQCLDNVKGARSFPVAQYGSDEQIAVQCVAENPHGGKTLDNCINKKVADRKAKVENDHFNALIQSCLPASPPNQLTVPMKRNGVVVKPYCFYLANGGESCTAACRRLKPDGVCSTAGLAFAAKSVDKCKSIVREFGSLDFSRSGQYKDDDSGCTYGDWGKPENRWVQVMKRSASGPSCDAVNSDKSRMRVCACE